MDSLRYGQVSKRVAIADKNKEMPNSRLQ